MSDANTAISHPLRRDVRALEDEPAFRIFLEGRDGDRLFFFYANGEIDSLPYHQMTRLRLRHDIGAVEIEFVGHRVTIFGRNLTALVLRLGEESCADIIERHDVNDIEPSDPVEHEAWRHRTYVDRIDVETI